MDLPLAVARSELLEPQAGAACVCVCDPTVGAIKSNTRAEPKREIRKNTGAQSSSTRILPAARSVPENHFILPSFSLSPYSLTPRPASSEESLVGLPVIRARRCSLTPSVQLLFLVAPVNSFASEELQGRGAGRT